MSNNAGRFVISLDCEGKWGMADHIQPFHDEHITHERLVFAYRTICDLLERHNMSATFAFVMAFILDADGREYFRDHFCDDLVEGQNWLHHFRKAQSSGSLDGWFCPEALGIVKDSGRHEIAAHGFSHVPLAERLVSRDVADRELRACNDVAQHLDFNLSTFVYPRNHIGHVEALASAGIDGYRIAPQRISKIPTRLSNLITEANIFDKAEDALEDHPSGVKRIPGGHMVNWQSGPRKAIPRWVSSRRWSSILADAATNGKVAHLWLHPHNILTAPKTLNRLDDILRQASFWRNQGQLEIVTQAQFIGSHPA